MAIVQSSYSERIGQAYAGMIASNHTCDYDAYIAEGANGIGFGLAVQIGDNSGGCKIGVDTGTYLGFTSLDKTRDPADKDKYKAGANTSVMTRGDIWVKVGGVVTFGGDVTVTASTGVASSLAVVDDTQILIKGAVWRSSAAASGDLAILRLSGELPTTT